MSENATIGLRRKRDEAAQTAREAWDKYRAARSESERQHWLGRYSVARQLEANLTISLEDGWAKVRWEA